ncbi:hypothetical protein Dimus_000383 [Dionaea muscipula]
MASDCATWKPPPWKLQFIIFLCNPHCPTTAIHYLPPPSPSMADQAATTTTMDAGRCPSQPPPSPPSPSTITATIPTPQAHHPAMSAHPATSPASSSRASAAAANIEQQRPWKERAGRRRAGIAMAAGEGGDNSSSRRRGGLLHRKGCGNERAGEVAAGEWRERELCRRRSSPETVFSDGG